MFLDDGRGFAARQMGAHVDAVGVEHNELAAGAAVEDEVFAEEAQRHGFGAQLGSLGDHEPAARKVKLSELVIFTHRHDCDSESPGKL